MKLRVTVEGRTFDVDVLDPQARPVVAVVEGERFEVWPEGDGGRRARDEGASVVLSSPAASSLSVPAPAPPSQNGRDVASAGAAAGAILAPIPGVIVKVLVEPGARVTAGQEVCVLEAMKMQNAVRAPRDGVIAQVRVAAGQTVRHREPLMEYAP